MFRKFLVCTLLFFSSFLFADFPVVQSTNTSVEATNTTSHSVSMPAGISVGDLLLVFFSTDGDNTISGWDDFTEIFNTSNGSAVSLSIAYKIAVGSDTLTITTSENEESAHAIYRITGHSTTVMPEVSTGATGSDDSPNPDSLDPTGTTKDFLWIAVEGNDHLDIVTSWPTNFDGSNIQDNPGNANGCNVAVGTYSFSTETMNPDVFTLNNSEQWIATTVVVHPSVFTPIASEGGFNSGSGTELDTDGTLNIEIGDVLVACIGWEGGVSNGVQIFEDDDSSNEFTILTEQTGNSNFLRLAWVVVDSANAAATFRATLSTARSWRSFSVLQFRPDAGTVTFEDGGDADSDGTGASGAASISGNISTVGDNDVLTVAFIKWFSTTTTETNWEIGNQAADGNDDTGNYMWTWYKAFNSAQTDINATMTWSGNVNWLTDLVALKLVAGGETHALVGSADSISLLSGGVIVTWTITGSADSISLLNASITLTFFLNGNSQSISLFSGSIIRLLLVIGLVSTISLLSGTKHIVNDLAGSVDSISLLSGTLDVGQKLVGSADSISLLSGSFDIDIKLTGSADSISLLSGALDVIPSGPVTHSLVGSADSISLLSGAIDVKQLIVGSSDSISLLSGAIDIKQLLVGSSDSISLLSGTLDTTIQIIGSSDSISLLSGTLDVTQNLSGSADSISLLSGALTVIPGGVVTRYLEGSADSISLLSGELSVTIDLSGITNSISLLSGTLIIVRLKIIELTSNIWNNVSRTSNIKDEVIQVSNIQDEQEGESEL